MHESDPVMPGHTRTRELDRSPRDLDYSSVRAEHAAQDPEQSRLPGTVLTEDAMHLTGENLQVGPGERLDRPEAPMNAPESGENRSHR